MGVMGMFNAIISPATTIADMGVSTSSVRNIASSENDQETARQVSAVKMFYLVVKFFDNLCDDPFGRIFKKKNAGRIIGDMDYICIGFCCSFSVLVNFFNSVLQAKGKIASLVMAQIYATVLGSIFSLVVIYFFRVDGIVWSLLIGAMLGLPVAWYFFSKLKIPKVKMTSKRIFYYN